MRCAVTKARPHGNKRLPKPTNQQGKMQQHDDDESQKPPATPEQRKSQRRSTSLFKRPAAAAAVATQMTAPPEKSTTTSPTKSPATVCNNAALRQRQQKEAYVGMRVDKFFGAVRYTGTVTAYFPAEEMEPGVGELWNIRFDDDDQEDVDEKELIALLKIYDEKHDRHRHGPKHNKRPRQPPPSAVALTTPTAPTTKKKKTKKYPAGK
jgi:hypothetical protein